MNAGTFSMPYPSNNPRGRVVDPDAPENERSYALATHLSLLAIHLIGIPGIIPLTMWLIRKGVSPFLDDHCKEALNFQISLLIYGIACIPLCAILVGFPLLFGVYALGIVGCIMGAMAAYRGEFFRYPMTIRLIG